MIALSQKEQIEYILEEDRGHESPTVFLLRPLSVREVVEIEDLVATRDESKGMPAGTFAYKVLRASLSGWRNLKDKTGVEIKYERAYDGKVKEDLLLRFTTAQRFELANAVWGLANITDEEAKN